MTDGLCFFFTENIIALMKSCVREGQNLNMDGRDFRRVTLIFIETRTRKFKNARL